MTNEERLEKLLDHLEATISIDDALARVRENYREEFEDFGFAFERAWHDHKDCFEEV